MKKKAFLCAAAAGMMILTASAANAATLTTSDGVLSIETPSDAWVQTQDPNYWFVISNGTDTITIDHLSNGQSLPSVQVANDAVPAVYQAFVSTKNEVFVIKGLSSSQEGLKSIMETISSIRVLQLDTKKAVQQAPAPQASEFSIRPINATYYVTCSDLHVRSGYSTDESILGDLSYGDAVTVIGSVTKGGQDYGWYQIQYNGGTAYASAGFLSTARPASASSQSSSSQSSSSQNSSEKKSAPSGAVVSGNSFDVTDNKGYVVATLTLYSDGYYYSENGVAYVSNGNGSYYPANGGGIMSTVYDSTYLSRLDDDPVSYGPGNAYSLGVIEDVWSENGNYQGTLTLYSDGYYYSADGFAYSTIGDGCFYGAGEVLYNYQGRTKSDEIGTAGSNYYDGSKSDEIGTAGSNYYDDDDNYNTNGNVLIHDGAGGALYIYPTNDQYDTYMDDEGNSYYQDSNGNWVSDSPTDDTIYWESDY